MRRREFIQTLPGVAAAAAALGQARWSMGESDKLGAVLPRRALGATGEAVTCLGLGGYHVGWTTEALAQATIEAALEEGVRFFDSAESYGPHTSEARYGKHLTPRYRDSVFLMTKTGARTAAQAKEHLAGSLQRLNTDVLDLWQLHAIDSPDDVDGRLAQGVLDVALQAQAAGKVRHIGFTGHANPYAHAHLLAKAAERGRPFAACQFPVNPIDAAAEHSFIRTVLPQATDAGLGVLAMKTLADGRFFGSKTMNDKTVWTADAPVVPAAASVAQCIHFALTLPISVLITGAENPALLREKAELVRAFTALTPAERGQLVGRTARFAQAGRVEYYKSPSPQGMEKTP